MKLKLADGREINQLAVETYQNLLRSVAMLELLNDEDLKWIREQINGTIPTIGMAEAGVLIEYRDLLNKEID